VTTTLLLVRHGRSAHAHDGSWIDAAGARRFEDLYDAAPIRADDAPPEHLMRLARAAHVILASDLPRAITSARALAPDRDPVLSPLLRELRFNLPAWAPRLPLHVWDGLHEVMWRGRLLAGVENDETRRAHDAAAWLEAQLDGGPLAVVVTHGGFRRLVARALTRRGWMPARERRPFHNWSAWTLTR
jgi:broad specificity phosphatase PhoE